MDTKILDKNSLAETLSRLEAVRLGFANSSKYEIEESLEWLLSRHGLPGSYCEQRSTKFFAPTASDLKSVLLPSGERLTSPAAIKHIMGEETLRALVLWKMRSKPETKNGIEALNALLDINKTGMGRPIVPGRESGRFCCSTCTPAFLRAVNAVKTEKWEKTLENGISGIKKARTPDGKWRGYKFYYTLLMLAEAEVTGSKQELRHAREFAEKNIKRYQNKTDRTSKFRAHALEAALAA